MADETLLTAARRVVRYFNIDMCAGGLITPETQHAIETLDRMVRAADAQERRIVQHVGAATAAAIYGRSPVADLLASGDAAP